ncbi:hypothetical protein IJS64_04485 [bacterium]|nr:hypothetical protein [bacterium]
MLYVALCSLIDTVAPLSETSTESILITFSELFVNFTVRTLSDVDVLDKLNHPLAKYVLEDSLDGFAE